MNFQDVRENLKMVSETPSFLQELRPYHIEQMLQYVEVSKKLLKRKYGLNEDESISVSVFRLNAVPSPEMADVDEWWYLERAENIILNYKKESAAKMEIQRSLSLSTKKGMKTNLIRVLDALWQLRFFTDENGQVVTQRAIMEAFGELLGEDFSNFESILSQAYNYAKLETNLEIFEQMKEKVNLKCIK